MRDPEDWSHREASQAPAFRGCAADLGLDLADAQALGVQGTPTSFSDGRRIEPTSSDHLRRLVEQALADAR